MTDDPLFLGVLIAVVFIGGWMVGVAVRRRWEARKR